MTESLDEFFARCEDVLADWRGSADAMNTATKPSRMLWPELPMPNLSDPTFMRLQEGDSVMVDGVTGWITTRIANGDNLVTYEVSAIDPSPVPRLYTFEGDH